MGHTTLYQHGTIDTVVTVVMVRSGMGRSGDEGAMDGLCLRVGRSVVQRMIEWDEAVRGAAAYVSSPRGKGEESPVMNREPTSEAEMARRYAIVAADVLRSCVEEILAVNGSPLLSTENGVRAYLDSGRPLWKPSTGDCVLLDQDFDGPTTYCATKVDLDVLRGTGDPVGSLDQASDDDIRRDEAVRWIASEPGQWFPLEDSSTTADYRSAQMPSSPSVATQSRAD